MKLCLTFFTLAFLAILATPQQPLNPFILKLRISIVYLPQATSQPISGLWSPKENKLIFSSIEQSGLVYVFDCGYVIGVTFPTRTNYTYVCEASDNGMKTWLGSSLLVLGSGEEVTLYDNIKSKRFYRVREQLYVP